MSDALAPALLPERTAVSLPLRLRAALRAMAERRVALVITFIAYFAIAQLAFFLYRGFGTSPSVIIAPAGIALAAILIEGYIVWPVIALAALLNSVVNGSSPLLILASVTANTAQAVITYYLLHRFNFDRLFQHARDVFLFMGITALTSAIVPAFVASAIAVQNTLTGASVQPPWLSWWLGGALNAFVVTPFLIRWVKRRFAPRTPAKWMEMGAALTLLAVISFFLFATPYTTIFTVSLLIPLFLPLFWLAFRGGPRFMTLALFVYTVISLLGAVYGTHAPTATPQTLAQRVFNTEVFDLIIVVFFFILVTIEEQRSRTHTALALHVRKLEAVTERIKKSDDAKSDFIALLGHELRNPLASILSTVELLKIARPAETERVELLDAMDDRVRTMARLLDDILDITRIRERKFLLKKERVDARHIVRRAAAVVEPLAQREEHDLMLSLPDEEIAVDADPARLEQVVVNLIHNAIKYTPRGGRILLSLMQLGGRVELSVQDNGIGIDPSMLRKIFEPFAQLRAKGKREGGIGLGLSLAKSLVEMHGGSIEAASAGDGNGSVFTVYLPSAGTIASERTENESVRPANALSILVVDDNTDAATALGKLLRLRGHTVAVANDGATAVKMALTEQPEVVILDIGLPDIDGYEVAKELRNNGVTAAIIALTGYGQDSDKQKAHEAGFDAHLTKPVGLSDIENTLAEIFNA